jgi:hypothetical protein
MEKKTSPKISPKISEEITFTYYTLVRLRMSPEGDKRVLFVTYQLDGDIYTEHDVATDLIQEVEEEGLIPLRSENGQIRMITVGKAKPSFAIFLMRYRAVQLEPGVPGSQIFLSWRRLKNGWPTSYATDKKLLQATYAERYNFNGWTKGPIDPKLETMPMRRMQFDTEQKGLSQSIFERKIDDAIALFKKEDRCLNITQLIDTMPTIDQVLCEHLLWKERGQVSISDVKLFLDHMYLETLFK